MSDTEFRQSDDRSGELIAILSSVRTRLRALLALDGLALLLIRAVAAFVVFAFLDWWVHFPSFVRAAVLGVGALWAVQWSWRRIARPLIASISLQQLALQLGSLTPNARDRLASAVAYLYGGAEGSPVLWERVVERALASTQEAPPSRALLVARPVRSLLLALALLAMASGAYWIAPASASIAWRRIAYPLGGAAWPKTVEIEPLTGDAIVPQGEDFTVEMRLVRGGGRGVRAYVLLDEPGAPPSRHPMLMHPDFVFRHTLARLSRDVRYHFVAGDDDTADRPGLLRVVNRPQVVEARLLVEPPPYVADRRATLHPLLEGRIAVVAGSRARCEVAPNRSLHERPDAEAGFLKFEDGERVPLSSSGPDGAIRSAEFLIERDESFEILLIDQLGVASGGGRKYQLSALPDRPPQVLLLSPAPDVECTPRATLSVVAEAKDEFAVTRMNLVAAVNGGDFGPVADLLASAARPEGEAPSIVSVEYAWRLGGLSTELEPGDAIQYAAEAEDNFEPAEVHSRIARSESQRVRIISVTHLAELLAKELGEAREDLRRLLSGLLSIREQTTLLDMRLDDRDEGDEVFSRESIRLAKELTRLSDVAEGMAAELGNLTARARANQAAQLEVAIRAGRVQELLEALSAGAFPTAADELSLVGEASSRDERRSRLEASSQAQDELLGALQSALAALTTWEEFADVVRSARELLDRQESLIRSGAALAPVLGGRTVAELESAAAAQLQEVVSRQRELARDARALLVNLRQIAARLSERDWIAAESLHRAEAAATRLQIEPHMEQAAAALADNRINRARRDQERACDGLRAFLSELESKPDRELATLARMLGDHLARLDLVIRTQMELLESTKTHDSAESAAWEGLADRQNALAATTEKLAGDLDSSEYEGVAARIELLDAVSRMQSAARGLEAGSRETTVAHQEQALESLREARDLLDRFQEKTDERRAERSLDAIRQELLDLLARQRELRGQTAAILTDGRVRQGLSKVERLRVVALSEKQRGLLEPLGDVRDKMLRSIVFQYQCDQARRAAEMAAERLAAEEMNRAMPYQDEVLRILRKLIEAIESRPPRKGSEFAIAPGGGGGGASAPKLSKPIPTLAELIVLRSMQADLAQRTRSLDESLPEPILRTEEQLAETEALGQAQGQLHELSRRLIEAAGEEE